MQWIGTRCEEEQEVIFPFKLVDVLSNANARLQDVNDLFL